MKHFKPDPSDPLKVRRNLALLSALYSFFIWPHLLIFYFLYLGIPHETVKEMLTYIGMLASGPIGAYLWAAHKSTPMPSLPEDDDDPELKESD